MSKTADTKSPTKWTTVVGGGSRMPGRSVASYRLRMSMSMKLMDLHALPDDELIRRHDVEAKNTVVGTAYWMKELERRNWERVEQSNTRLARASLGVAVGSLSVAFVSIVIAVVSLLVR